MWSKIVGALTKIICNILRLIGRGNEQCKGATHQQYNRRCKQ